MSDNKIQNVDLSALNGLSPEERKLAIEMLKEIADTGKSELLEKMKYGDFEEIPVDIHTFLHDRKYLGNGLYDQDGRFTLFPYWEETLKKIFPDNITTAYNTLILTGSIGIGKSTCAVICQLYMLYRLLCLKDPYLYYGMQPIDKITISLMNITIENAKGVALDKLNQLILSSDWFMSHGEMHGTTNMIFVPDKHIEFVCASSNNQIIGRALFCNFSDEVNFDARSANVERQKARLKQIISQVDARMASRFLRGDFLPTLNIIASSKASDQSFLDDYIETKRRGESKTTLIIDEPQWVVDSRKQTGKWFKVAVGDRYLPNELIPEGVDVETYRAKGYTRIIDVPSGYLEKFKDNIELALTDIAGISTASATKYISGISWNAIKADYENPFIKEIIEVGNSPDDHAQYANFFDLSKVPNEWKSRPMWIHLDMSSGSLGKGDKTGIAGVWIKGKRPSVEGEDITREMYYRVAFSVSIKAPKGFSISFMKHRNFIRWLRDQGFAIKGISCFTGDTLIATPEGNRMIKDIKIGDKVFAYDDNKHCLAEKEVYNVIEHEPRSEFIKVWFTDEDFIECTPEHLIKTANGYKKAIDLTEDDLIEVDDYIYYRQKLLATGYFVENEALDKYIKLIIEAKNNACEATYSERHHIIPKVVYKTLKLPINNKKINLVQLSFLDHIKAHYLLSKCTVSSLGEQMQFAVARMLGGIDSKVSMEEQLTNESLIAELLDNKQTFIKKLYNNSYAKGNHPKSEFKVGHASWNTGLNYFLQYSDEERKRFAHKNTYYWCTNGKINKLIKTDEALPEGFYKGRYISEEIKSKISASVIARGAHGKSKSGWHYYTDGKTNIKLSDDIDPPVGFRPGKTNHVQIHTSFLDSDKAKSIDINAYKKYYMEHSMLDTIKAFGISRANHKALCKAFNIKKPRTKYYKEVTK